MITTKYTEKLFYKKYTHKIVVLYDDKIVNGELVYPCEGIENLLDWCIKNFGEYTFKYRTDTTYQKITKNVRLHNVGYEKIENVIDGYQTTIYFSSEENLEKMVAEYGDKIKSINKPKNKEHADLMESGTVSVMRNKLFWNKFRFKIVCDKTIVTYIGLLERFDAKIQEDNNLQEWFNEHTTDETALWFSSYDHYTAYFVDEDDAMFFRLTFGDKVKETLKVLLPKEI